MKVLQAISTECATEKKSLKIKDPKCFGKLKKPIAF